MAIGLVQERGHSQKGAPKLKISGVWHFVGRTNVDGIEPGMQVEYDAKPFGDKGTLSGLNSIRPAPQAQAPAMTTGATWTTQTVARSPQTGSTIMDGDILRSVSNIVGNACAAGSVKYPSDLLEWVNIAYIALTGMGKAQPPDAGDARGAASKDEDEGFGDDLDKMPPW